MYVYLELGAKRAFACAVDWPGWCRSGKTEDAALEALLAYWPRYAEVATSAGDTLPEVFATDVHVVERLAGDATTDFGTPAKIPDADRRKLFDAEPARLAAYYEASWALLEDIAAGSPQELRKGPGAAAGTATRWCSTR